MITKKDLDIKICDYYNEKYDNDTITNKQTFREFIIESENEFGMENQDLDNMSDDKLGGHMEFLDYLWEK